MHCKHLVKNFAALEYLNPAIHQFYFHFQLHQQPKEITKPQYIDTPWHG